MTATPKFRGESLPSVMHSHHFLGSSFIALEALNK